MGAIAAKFRGPVDPSLPPFVALADNMKSDVWGAGEMGGGLAGLGARVAHDFPERAGVLPRPP